MKPVKIFVEKIRHRKFLSDLIKYKLGYNLSESDFVVLGSKSGILKARSFLEQNSDKGGTNIVVFDTIYDINESNNFFKEIKEDLKVDFVSFSLPNNRDSGNLESLLYEIIGDYSDEFKPIFKSYEDEIKLQPELKSPSFSGKISAYLDSVLELSESDMLISETRNYIDSRCWNLNHLSLDPLSNFLSKNLK